MLSRSTEGPKAGDLRYKVDIATPDDPNGYGEPGTTVLSDVPADVKDLSGVELIRAQALTDKTTHIVTMRFNPLVKEQMIVKSNGRLLYISAILDRNKPVRGVWMDLLCYTGSV